MEMLRVLVPNRVDAGLRMCRWQLKRDLFAPTRSSTLTINSFRYESSRSCELLPAFWSSLPNNSSSSLPTSHRASSAPSSNRTDLLHRQPVFTLTLTLFDPPIYFQLQLRLVHSNACVSQPAIQPVPK
eukprot:gene1067-4298_t